MNIKLRKFYQDVETRELVEESFRQFLLERAGALAVQGEDTNGIKDADIAITDFFKALDKRFAVKGEKKVENPE